MAKKKKKKQTIEYINLVHVTIILILFLGIIFMFNSLEKVCWDSVPTCYKTECNFWGCSEIEVDINSPQCEIKKDRCISGTYVFNW